MATPTWLTGAFAALMLTVAVYCAGRLAAAGRWRRPTEVDTDTGHVLMGLAMAGMLVARLRILPAAAWGAVFAAGAAWFAWRLLRTGRRPPASPWRCLHPAPHLVECAAMLYMFTSLPGRGAAVGTTGMTASAAGPRFSFLALVMALFMAGYVVRVTDCLTLHGPTLHGLTLHGPTLHGPTLHGPALAVSSAGQHAAARQGGGGPVGSRCLAPRCAALCKIAMGITMGYMLVLML